MLFVNNMNGKNELINIYKLIDSRYDIKFNII